MTNVLLGVTTVIIILAWTFYALKALGFDISPALTPRNTFDLKILNPGQVWEKIKRLIDEPEEVANIFVLLGVLIAILGYIFLYGRGSLKTLIGDFYANLAAELISIAVTVLVVERLYEKRSDQREKASLILQMGSPDHAFSIEATRQLRHRGWLEDGSLQGADLRNTDLTNADLRKADLSKADLQKACLNGANLWHAKLRQVRLSDAEMIGTFLGGADLYGANLIDAKMARAILFGVDLRQAFIGPSDLSEAEFLGADLSETDLSGACLRSAGLENVSLERADLSNADLCGANLSGANLKDVILDGSVYTEDTIWPEGFMPDFYGAILIEA